MSACTCDHFEWFNATCPCCMGPQSGHDASGNRPCSCSPVVKAARRLVEDWHENSSVEQPLLEALSAAVRELDAKGETTTRRGSVEPFGDPFGPDEERPADCGFCTVQGKWFHINHECGEHGDL